jgi:hypothetical protein
LNEGGRGEDGWTETTEARWMSSYN